MTSKGTVAKGFSPIWTLLITSIAFFMTSLDLLVVTTALPSISRDLGAGTSTLEWTVNAYSLATAALTITTATLGDKFGRRLVFFAGLMLFTVSSAVCALSPSASVLIVMRAVQGIGAATMMPLSLTLLTSAFPPQRRGTVIGIWGGIAGLGIAIGPLVGGAIAQGLDWRWIFWINVPVGLVAAVVCRKLPESKGPGTQLDLMGVVLVTGGVFGLVWGLTRGNLVGWLSLQTLAAIGIGILVLVGFVQWESRATHPMMPLRLFRNRVFAAVNVTAFLMTASLMGAAFAISQYLQEVLGNSPLNAGLKFLPMTATPLLVAPMAGMLSNRISRRWLMAIGLLAQGIGLVWLAEVATAHTGYGRLVVPLITAGIGVSIPFAVTPAAAMGAVPSADMGRASGTTNTVQRFGGVFGIALVTAAISSGGHIGIPSVDHGFRLALAVSACLSVIGAVTALAVRNRQSTSAAYVATSVISKNSVTEP